MYEFRASDTGKVVLIALSTLNLATFQTMDAVLNVNRAFVGMAANSGAGHIDLLCYVYLPACLPQSLTRLRIALSRALVSTISLGLISALDGLAA